jgi:hypothetical protein
MFSFNSPSFLLKKCKWVLGGIGLHPGKKLLSGIEFGHENHRCNGQANKQTLVPSHWGMGFALFIFLILTFIER